MIRVVYDLIYKKNLIHIVILMILAIIFWSVLGWLFVNRIDKKKFWKIFNSILFVAEVLAIAIITVFSRKTQSTTLILMPFQFLQEAKTVSEVYRSMLMNVLLFMPYGLTMVNFISGKNTSKIIWTILTACVFSVGIEYCQYKLQLGRAEVDDVLCNTFGAALGSQACVIQNGLKKIKKKLFINQD